MNCQLLQKLSLFLHPMLQRTRCSQKVISLTYSSSCVTGSPLGSVVAFLWTWLALLKPVVVNMSSCFFLAVTTIGEGNSLVVVDPRLDCTTVLLLVIVTSHSLRLMCNQLPTTLYVDMLSFSGL